MQRLGIDTIEANMVVFLKDKTKQLTLQLENAKQDFELFWKHFWIDIRAERDLARALAEWDIKYHSSLPK